jgi:glycosyltransferase involved in cell wall biosynthesis
MRIAISTTRQAHYKLPANSFVSRNHEVTVYSSTPAGRFRGFDASLTHRFVPAPITLFNALTRIGPPVWMNELDTALYDRLVALRMGECDLFLGGASGSLYTGKAVQRNGGIFVLDRACPHIQFQQELLVEEARKAGGTFRRQTPWFLERQLEEYEQADFLLMPSNYSIRSYPEHIRRKAILAPLCARINSSARVRKAPGSPFVVGAVGGQPLRKGYLYLLEAWKRLALPNAQLKIRSNQDYRNFSVLARLAAEQSNVEFLPYIPDIGAFYSQCDAFILPSVDDGFGMALFEAMARGVPSITTHSTGASELLVNGRDAIVIDAGKTEQIQEALLTLYESSSARERLGLNGQLAVAALNEGDIPRPYSDGIDSLFHAVEGQMNAAAR